MIEFHQVSKAYGGFAAVRALELSVAKGEVFGFLGPNGAGKTTTIRMMMGILVPSAGSITIDGLGTWLAAVMDECGAWDGAAESAAAGSRAFFPHSGSAP